MNIGDPVTVLDQIGLTLSRSRIASGEIDDQLSRWTGLLRGRPFRSRQLLLVRRHVVEARMQSLTIAEALDVCDELVLDIVNVGRNSLEQARL
jgi:hypothetical protein